MYILWQAFHDQLMLQAMALLPDDEDEPEELPESSESEDEPRSLASAVAIESLMGINGELVGWLIYLVNNG